MDDRCACCKAKLDLSFKGPGTFNGCDELSYTKTSMSVHHANCVPDTSMHRIDWFPFDVGLFTNLFRQRGNGEVLQAIYETRAMRWYRDPWQSEHSETALKSDLILHRTMFVSGRLAIRRHESILSASAPSQACQETRVNEQASC